MEKEATPIYRSKRRSCVLCHARKIKCDRQQPCDNCIRAAANCTYPVGTGRAPRRPQHALNPAVLDGLGRLESIIRRLESHQAQRHPLDASVEGGDANQSPSYTSATAANSPPIDLRCGRLAIDRTRSVYVSNVLWASLGDEIEELRDLLHGSPSNDEDEERDDEGEFASEQPLHTPIGALGLNAAIMGFKSLAHSLRGYHPPLSQSVALFEIFKANIAPVVSIFHMPTLTKLFWDAVASLDSVDRNMEALLFAMYYAAIISTTPDQWILELSRPQALRTYRFAVEQALARADILNTQNIILLQAAALFLAALRNEDDSRTVWSLTALILHIAQAMGLHRDGAAFGLRPLETELRRRLWWFIVGLDQRSSEYHGCEPIVQESAFDTRLPLNINDTDLTPDMTQPPIERDGPTQMTLSLIGWEAISIVRKVSFIPPHHRSRTSSGPPMAVAELPVPEREALAEKLQRRLETRYVQYCDSTDPFLVVSATVARLIIARVWLMIHYNRKHKGEANAPLLESLRDRLFLLSIEILELSSSLLCNPSTAQWAWRSETYIHWHAVALALSEICARPPSRDCDRAWTAVEILYDRWCMKDHARKGTLWKPIGRLMAKARYVREMQVLDQSNHGRGRRGGHAGSSPRGSSTIPQTPAVQQGHPMDGDLSNILASEPLDPLTEVFSLTPSMGGLNSYDHLFSAIPDDGFVQVDMWTGGA